MTGITYYRLKSNYDGDYTKNCALNGTEVDNNFYVLEGRDIESISASGKDIVITLLNGDTLRAKGALDFVKPEDIQTSVVSVAFDSLNGIMTLTKADGTTQTIEGIASNENTDFSVSTDNTLSGSGIRNTPLSIAPSARTGQYKTVKAIIDVANHGSLPTRGNVLGDRYVTCEDVSDYGYLYDYKAVREIAGALRKSGWRIPTKDDWDDLLNAVEPCSCDRNHDQANCNRYLGKWAGKLLKSKTMWKADDCDDCDCEEKHHHHHHNCADESTSDEDYTCIDYSDDDTSCDDTNESRSEHKHSKKHSKGSGIDAYGFRATPSGYADDGCNFSYFRERASFWTGTTTKDNSKAFIKRFQYNKDGVYQDVIAGNYHLSLRLVKDYDGKNFQDVVEIMDMEYPALLLPSVSKGKSIWTAANFACGDTSLRPMLPNNGQGLTFARHFFINEWDGFKWVRNELKPGESVVVAKAPGKKTMVEYRVVDNDLVSVNQMIYDDVITDVQEIIDEVVQNNESSASSIQETIESLETAISEETTAREEADSTLQENIDNEATAREEADTTLQENIDTEATTREEADTALQENIDTEAATREEADATLQENIDTEATTREEADTALQENIDNEATAREEADTTLQENIDAEVAAREALEGSLLVQEGSEFDGDTGELTLKSKDGTNDITVQFTFNFGEF